MPPKSFMWLIASALVSAIIPGNMVPPCQGCTCCELEAPASSETLPAIDGCIHCCAGTATATGTCIAADRCSCEWPVTLVGTEPEQELLRCAGAIVQQIRTTAECHQHIVAELDRTTVHHLHGRRLHACGMYRSLKSPNTLDCVIW